MGKRESDGDGVSAAPIAKVRENSNGRKAIQREGRWRIKECRPEEKETERSGGEEAAGKREVRLGGGGKPYKLIAREETDKIPRPRRFLRQLYE